MLTILLCTVLLGCFTGCNREKQAADSVVGVWKTTIRYADYIQQLDELFDGAGSRMDLTGLQLELVLTLDAEGGYLLEADRASVEQLLSDLREPLMQAVRDMLCADNHVTEAGLDRLLADRGIDLDARVDQYLDQMRGSAVWQRRTGSYRFTEGKLYLTEQGEAYYAIQTATDQLRILSAEGGDPVGLAPLLPLEFTWFST